MVRFAEYPTWGGAAAVTVLVAAAVTLLYRYAIGRQPPARRTCLLGLRCLWVVLATLVLLRPVVDDILPPARRILAVLLDSSLSMAVSDGKDTRYETAMKSANSIQNPGGGWEIRKMSFSQTVELTPPDKPRGLSTDIAAAIDAGRLTAGPGGAVILMTDGVSTAGDAPVRAAERAASAGIPIVALYPVAAPIHERRIVKVQYDAIINQNQMTEIKVYTAGPGPCKVKLIRGGMVISQATAEGGDQPVPVSLAYAPEKLGLTDLQIDVEKFPNELIEADNSCTITQRVVRRRDAVIAVLWIEPKWDVRGVVTSLEGVIGVNVKSIAGSAGEWSAPNGPIGLRGVEHADAVIFIGVPAKAVGWAAQELLVTAVEKGMGLAMIGGPEGFGKGGWAGTPLSKALPVQIHPNELFLDGPEFEPRITPIGRPDPLTYGNRSVEGGILGSAGILPAHGRARRARSQKGNSTLYRPVTTHGNFPLTKSANAVGQAKPASSVLAVHPTASGTDGPVILLAKGRYGDGRTLAVAMADLWRWAYKSPDGRKSMETFWRKAAAYIAPIDPARLEIEMPGIWASPGQEVEARVRVLGPGGRIVWHADGAGVRDSGILPPAGGRIRLRPDAEGSLSLTVDAPASDAGPAEQGRATLNVSAAAAEGKNFTPDTGLLSTIAKVSSGLTAPFQDASKALASLAQLPVPGARRREREIWDQPLILAVFIGLLAMEWTLRRWWGLP